MSFPVGRAGQAFLHETAETQNNNPERAEAAGKPDGSPLVKAEAKGAGDTGQETSSIDAALSTFDFGFSSKDEAAAEKEDKPSNANQDPGFVVPPRRGAERLNQPIGLNSSKFNTTSELLRFPIQPILASAAFGNAVHTSSHTPSPQMQEAGTILSEAQRGFSALRSGFNVLAASDKQRRYKKQLDALLKEDVAQFTGAVGKGKQEDARLGGESAGGEAHADGTPSKAYPSQQTLLLTKDRKGNFRYDMEKVDSLADSKDPALAKESLHAKNIRLTEMIANDVARKQKNRAAYGMLRDTIGTVGTVAATAGTHGALPAARAAGSALSAGGGVDVGGLIRNSKSEARNQKRSAIQTLETLNRHEFGEQNRDGFKQPEVRFASPLEVKNKDGQTEFIQSYPARTTPVADVPAPAIEAALRATHKQTVSAVNRKYRFAGGLVGGKNVNEDRASAPKGARRGTAMEHAAEVVMYNIGPSTPERLATFKGVLNDWAAAKQSKQDKVLKDFVNKDPGAAKAYRLIRDLGSDKGEALELIRRALTASLDQSIGGDDTLAALTGVTADRVKANQGEISGHLSKTMQRR